MLHYRAQIRKQWREIDLKPVYELPQEILRQATTQSLMWDVITWAVSDPRLLLVLDSAPMSLIKSVYREWQKDSQIQVSEVGQLIALIDAHGGALEADLIDRGMRLRDFPSERHNWRDLWVFVQYLGVHSNAYAATNPERAGWGRAEQLLAHIADDMSWIQWSKTEAAQNGAEPPDPIVRPGVAPREVRAGSRVKPSPISKIRERAKLKLAAQQDNPKGSHARLRQLEGLFR